MNRRLLALRVRLARLLGWARPRLARLADWARPQLLRLIGWLRSIRPLRMARPPRPARLIQTLRGFDPGRLNRLPGLGRLQRFAEMAGKARLLAAGCAALNAVLLAVLIHGIAAHKDAQARFEQARERHAAIARLAREYRALAGPEAPPPAARPASEILRLVAEAGRERGIPLTRLQQDAPARVSAAVGDIAYADLIDWLILLRQRHGLSAARIAINAGEVPGRVTCQFAFEAEGGESPFAGDLST